MKTTIEIPDELFRRAKAEAALRGESLKAFIGTALAERLAAGRPAAAAPEPEWRAVFGRAAARDVAEVDAVVERDLEVVDPEDWR
ncbi:MAG: hypothetical protein R2991_07470 [Thermoanaerobaculia bacterium]